MKIQSSFLFTLVSGALLLASASTVHAGGMDGLWNCHDINSKDAMADFELKVDGRSISGTIGGHTQTFEISNSKLTLRDKDSGTLANLRVKKRKVKFSMSMEEKSHYPDPESVTVTLRKTHGKSGTAVLKGNWAHSCCSYDGEHPYERTFSCDKQ
jgi:hypothetical protein